MADEEKPVAEPRPKPEPVPVATIRDDGSLQVARGVTMPQLYLLIQRAEHGLFEQVFKRAAHNEEMLIKLRDGYSFPLETELEIAKLIDGPREE